MTEELESLWGFDGDEPMIEVSEQSVVAHDEPDETHEEIDIEVDDDDASPDETYEEIDEKKPNKTPKTVPYTRFKEAISEKNELKARLQKMEDQLNGVIGVQEIVNKNKTTELSIDEKLKQLKIDPDKFFTEEEKNEALADKLERLELNKRLTQQEAKLQFNNTVAQIQDGINYMQETTPEYAESANSAIKVLIDNQKFFVKQRDPSLSKEKAQTIAYNEIISEVSNRSNATGEHPASIIVKLGAELASELGIDISPKNKTLQSKKNNSNINHKNREESQKRAGRPAIDTSASVGVKMDDETAKLFAMF